MDTPQTVDLCESNHNNNKQLESLTFKQISKQFDELSNKLNVLNINWPDCSDLSSECSDIESLKVNLNVDEDSFNEQYQKYVSKQHAVEYKMYGPRFMKLCIDPGKLNIYNVSNENIDLIKLGITFIFPNNSKLKCFACNDSFLNDKQTLFQHLLTYKHKQKIRNIEKKDLLPNYKKLFTSNNFEQGKFCLRIEKKNIHCCTCNYNIKKTKKTIDLHINSDEHILQCDSWKKKSAQILDEFLIIFNNIWYYAHVFFCAVCMNKFEDEFKFVKHLQQRKHFLRVKDLNTKSVEFHICPTCVTYWYGDEESYSKHCRNIFHKYFVKYEDFSVPNITTSVVDLLKNVDENMNFLLNESNKVVLESKEENEVLEAIEKSILCKYPKAKAYKFGSRLSSTSFPDSELEVFIDCKNCYYKCLTKKQIIKYLMTVCKYLECQSNIWLVREKILNSSVPIIKLNHLPTNIKVEISCNNGLLVEKSLLIRYYNTAYYICRNLILYLKKWFVLCRLKGISSMTNYAISWYVIFYLQVKGIIPSVYELIKMENKSKIIGGWECGFKDSVQVTNSALNFKEHIKELFLYYAEFDYKSNVACPYLGKVIKKNVFVSFKILPKEMNIYEKHLKENKCTVFPFYSPMCLQDPIDHSKNLTKHVTKLQLQSIRKYYKESIPIIS